MKIHKTENLGDDSTGWMDGINLGKAGKREGATAARRVEKCLCRV
jgi:hypothetical protein